MSVVRFDKAEVRCSFASVLSWTTWDCRVDAFRFTPARTVAAGPRICRGITVRSLITHVWWNLSTPSCTYTFWGVYRSIVCLFILHIKIAVCLHYHGCWDCQGSKFTARTFVADLCYRLSLQYSSCNGWFLKWWRAVFWVHCQEYKTPQAAPYSTIEQSYLFRLPQTPSTDHNLAQYHHHNILLHCSLNKRYGWGWGRGWDICTSCEHSQRHVVHIFHDVNS